MVCTTARSLQGQLSLAMTSTGVDVAVLGAVSSSMHALHMSWQQEDGINSCILKRT